MTIVIDDAYWKRVILEELRDPGIDTDGSETASAYNAEIESMIELVWPLYAGQRLSAPKLQALYVERHVIRRLLGMADREVDIERSGGANPGIVVRNNQIFKNLVTLYGIVKAEIIELVAGLQGTVGPKAGDLTTTAPIDPPTGSLIDANHQSYRGSPYYRRGRL